MKKYDLLIIGGGSAGLTAADFAIRLGASVAILEKNKIGGDCTWTGCIPSKTLLKSSKVAHEMQHADKYGLVPARNEVDFSSVMAHVRSVINDIYLEESPEVLRAEGIDVFLGPIEFIDPHTLSVGDDIVRGKSIIITTGAKVHIPQIEGIENVEYHTYETIWQLEKLPKKLLIVGAGMVGCELSQAFQRLGSEVSLIEAKECILPNIDRIAALTLEEVFRKDGIQLFTNAPVEHSWQDDVGIHLKSKDQEFVGDMLLLTTGRKPNVTSLGLENTGVVYTPEGIQVDQNLRTSQKHVYAAGDVAGAPQFTHVAGSQGYLAVRNALLPGSQKNNLSNLPWTLFTDPEIAQVGLSADEAKVQLGEKALSAIWPLSRVDRAHTEASKEGYIEVTYTKKGKILGATIVSPNAGELINEWALAISKELKVSDVANSLHVYPTYGMASMRLAAEIETERVLGGILGKVIGKLRKR
ncbi:MAG: FAD-dependent oxidoreductase [Anaerolineales bacterium]|nr:FAD-dependent oxidoreductase [Chloroflexota bacterium]MBL6982323.1 FAD-dependent oxidoreductase [Anaerolineales bacterium]